MKYYVSANFRYVLVEAADPDEARRLAPAAFDRLYAEDGRQHKGPYPICVVRPATERELEMQRDHDEWLERRRKRASGGA